MTMNATDRKGRVALKVRFCVLAAFLTVLGCGERPPDDVITTRSALGPLISVGPLTKTRIGSYTEPDPNIRKANTDAYYDTATTGLDGNGDTIKAFFDSDHNGLYANDLEAFRAIYFDFTGGVKNDAYYYNRGDLGIGREMHCTDSIAPNNSLGIVACYVTNFAAGDDNSEFTFGLSKDIAFANMRAGHSFATVAMVFREHMPLNSPNRVTFMVFGADGNLVNEAALDRYAIGRAGTPGRNHNLHIPTNCMSCHGGDYDPNTHLGNRALFLPFDLDQFEYEDVPGRRRDDQKDQFKGLNQMVRKVAARSGAVGAPIAAQIDTWYNNPANQFNSDAVPSGWTNFASTYRSFVRRSCRSCHMSLLDGYGKEFDTEAQFRSQITAYWSVDCPGAMPHALQNLREYWLSTAPKDMDTYLRTVGLSTVADGCLVNTPAQYVTLDPPQLSAALAGALL